MSESVESVKEASAYLRQLAEKFQHSSEGRHSAIMTGHADALDAVAERLVELEGLTSALSPDLGNIHDLPSELLSELSVAKTDELEDQLVTVINAYGGEASLDQILIGLYRKFSAVQKRRFVQNKLYRMDMIWSVAGKKGVYSTTKPPQDREAVEPDVPQAEDDTRAFTVEDFDKDVPF